MSCLTFDIHLNHIFFLFIFLVYFARELFADKIIADRLSKVDKGKIASRKFFNVFAYILSNFFSFIFIIISKYITKSNVEVKNKSKKDLNLIYTNPVSCKKLLKRTLLVGLSDFLSGYSVFILYIYTGKVLVKNIDLLLIFNILFIYLFSKILLKQSYYKHHYFSFVIVILCLLLIGITDIIKIKKAKQSLKIVFSYIIVRIFNSLFYAFEDVIGKKALIEEFLTPYTILLYSGFYEIILLLFFSIPFFFIKIENDYVFNYFLHRLDNFTNFILIFIQMIFNFLYNVVIWMINDRYSPNDIAMAMVIKALTDEFNLIIFETESFKEDLFISIYEIIIQFILIIGTFIHSEIIVINCCGLNENTKTKINLKGIEDFQQSFINQRNSSSINDESDDIELAKRIATFSNTIENLDSLKDYRDRTKSTLKQIKNNNDFNRFSQAINE